jgi:GDP-L-fucose synthase
MLRKKDKILIAGQEGMVGSAIYELVKKKCRIIECKRKDLDFTDYNKVNLFFKQTKPNIVINAAGKVGGIFDNSRYPIEYLNTNLSIGFNILNVAYKQNVKKVINIGSACIYPKRTKLPIKEEYLLKNYLEKTNEAYAIAKIAVLKLCEYYNIKKNKDYISIQPANLYGNNDNFDLESSHVIPALIRKFHEAKIKKNKIIKIWGNGRVTRDFMHVKDLADAILFLLNKKTSYSLINIGTGKETSIINLIKIIKNISKFNGKVIFDKTKPSGQLRRVLDISRMEKEGWTSKITLLKGLKSVFKNYAKN